MDIYILGQKAKYQFLREIVDGDVNFSNEFLSNKNIIVSGKIKNNEGSNFEESKEIHLRSNYLPLNTNLIFLSDFETYNDLETYKIIVFDEMPFNSKSIDILVNDLKNNNMGNVEIVLYNNYRQGLDSDTSNEEVAINDAIKFYSKQLFKVYRYKKGGGKQFLLFNKYKLSQNLKNKYISKFYDLEESLDSDVLKIEYELDYDFFIKDKVEDVNALSSITKFNTNMKNKSVTSVYLQNANNYLSKNDDIFDIIESMYIKFMKNHAFWDLKKDSKLLRQRITDEFQKYFSDMENIKFNGTNELDYILFMNNNDISIKFKNRYIEFFKEEVVVITKEYVYGKIEKVRNLI